MNLRDSQWHAELSVSGHKPIGLNGSLTKIFSEAMVQLSRINPRELKEGKSITIRIADKPVEQVSVLNQEIDKFVASIEIPRENQGPFEGESYEDFYSRLLSSGMPEPSAKYLANDWFGIIQDPQTLRLMHDAKALRFIQLNTISAEFESALPSEYAELKAYFIKEYPERAAQLTFRTA